MNLVKPTMRRQRLTKLPSKLASIIISDHTIVPLLLLLAPVVRQARATSVGAIKKDVYSFNRRVACVVGVVHIFPPTRKSQLISPTSADVEKRG